MANLEVTSQTYTTSDLTNNNYSLIDFKSCVFPNGTITEVNFTNSTFDANCSVTASGTCTFLRCNMTNVTKPAWAVFTDCNETQGVVIEE